MFPVRKPCAPRPRPAGQCITVQTIRRQRIAGGVMARPANRGSEKLQLQAEAPERLIDLRNCVGTIASVSTLARSSGATRLLRTVDFSFGCSSLFLRPGAFEGLATLPEILANALDRIASGREQRNQDHEKEPIHADLLLTPTAHIDEMPGSRHSKPASRNIRSRPSRSARGPVTACTGWRSMYSTASYRRPRRESRGCPRA